MAIRLRAPLAALALVSIVSSASPAWAALTVGAVTADPVTILTNAATPVKVTVQIDDPSVLPTGVLLQRLGASGAVANLGVMRDDGTNGDAVAGDRIFTLTPTFTEAQTGRIRLRVSVAFRSVLRRVLSEELSVPVGVLLPPEAGATIRGPGNTTLIVPADAIDVPIVAGIAPAPAGAIVAPVGNLPLVAAVDIMFDAPEQNGSLLPPTEPLQISVPAPAGTAGAEFIVAQQALVDATDGSGLRKTLIATAAAAAVGGAIQTQPSVLPGIRLAGTYAVVTATGSGFVTGVVTQAGAIQSGAVVSSNTNPLVAITDETGRFSLFVSGGPFTLTAFHPLRGSRGTVSGTIAVHGSTVAANITLIPLQTPAIAREGIRNSGFERCVEADSDGRGNITGSWAFEGDARATRQFQTLTGEPILPTEGACLAVISTGPASESTGATLRQRFVVPAGAGALRFDIRFVSEEFDEWVGSAFNDVFEARITTPDGDTLITRIQVNDFFDPATFGVKAGDLVLTGDCVAGGDDTCGRTGWRTAEIDLSRFAATGTPVTVDLVFAVSDRGDNLFDTHVLIDNIRFGTVWIDAKIVRAFDTAGAYIGADANAARVEAEVRGATEILSQAGLIVRLRRVLEIADPGPPPPPGALGNLTDVDTTWTTGASPCPSAQQIDGRLTAEETQAMLLFRSATPSDVNVYYVRSATRPGNGGAVAVGISGYAIAPDEYCNQVRHQINAGLFQMNLALGRYGVFPHELGHLILGPEPYTSTLEHSVNTIDPSNLMIPSGVQATAVVNRSQSANINRLGNLLIVP